MGKGNEKAKLVFIGEAPGEDEDRKGEPFVGRAGGMLDSIFADGDIKINRDDVYITNVAKCHPLFNSKPNVQSLETCASTYLSQELNAIHPELIICLGGMSGKTLLGEANITVAMHRNKIYYTKPPLPSGIPFIITYHPAATFHQPEYIGAILEDLEWAKRLLAGELPKPGKKGRYIKLHSIKDIPEWKEILEGKYVVDLDLETEGLDAFIPNRSILSCQLSLRESEGYYFDWSEKIAKQLYTMFSHLVSINGHNIKHDLKWLRQIVGIEAQGRVNDTIQDMRLIDENLPSYSLDILATSFTSLKGHKRDLVKRMEQYIKIHKEKKEPIRQARERLWKEAFNALPEKVKINYGCGDADATGQLRRFAKAKIRVMGLVPLHNIICENVKMFVDIEYNGMKVDLLELDRQRIEFGAKVKKLESKLIKLGGEINHNAPLQVRKLIYKKWKCYPHEIKMGKKRVRYSTGKDALELILKDNINDRARKYITKLLDYRKDSKLFGTYIEGMPRFLRNNNLIHAEWNLQGADSGRDSCHNPNLQQIPRKGDIKKLFISRFKRGVLVQLDSSQGELRIAAHTANEPTMIKLFNSGTADIHQSMAEYILKRKVTEDERYNTKQLNFLVLYEGGVNMILQEFKGMTREGGERFYNKWHDTFPGWKKHVAEMHKFIIDNHYIKSIFGRYRHLFVVDPKSEEGRKQLRVGINAQIQGALKDYMRLCGTRAWNKIRVEGLADHVLFINDTHDSYLLDTRDMGYAKQAIEILRKEFEEPDTSAFSFTFKVPMKVEIKVGPNWKEMEVYES